MDNHQFWKSKLPYMSTILGSEVRDAGFVGGKISWFTVKDEKSGKGFQNEFLVLQEHKSGYNPVGALSMINRNNKRYRILLSNTKSVLKNDRDTKLNELIGKTLVVAESDSFEEILSAWEKLDELLFPILATINTSREDKRLFWGDFIDMLSSIEDKRRKQKKYQIKSINIKNSTPKPINTTITMETKDVESPTSDNSPAMNPTFSSSFKTKYKISPTTPTENKGPEVIPQKISSEEKVSTATTSSVTTAITPPSKPVNTVNAFDPSKKAQVARIDDMEQATEAIAEYAQKIKLLKDLIKKLGTNRETQKIVETVESHLDRTRNLETEFEKFMTSNGIQQQPTKSNKQQQQSEQYQLMAKLNVQYQELKEIMHAQVMSNEQIQLIEVKKKKLEEEKQRKAQEERRKLLLAEEIAEEEQRKSINEEKSIEQLIQIEKDKKNAVQITKADLQTVEVEKSIASETLRDLQNLEIDMNELYEIHMDMNKMLKDQNDLIMDSINNVDDVNQDIQSGIQHLRGARNARTFGF